MSAAQPFRIRTISEFHQLRDLPKPEHPQISLIDVSPIRGLPNDAPPSWYMDFYMISMKRTISTNVKIKYGQQQYDFNEGLMTFMAPGQKGPHAGAMIVRQSDEHAALVALLQARPEGS